MAPLRRYFDSKLIARLSRAEITAKRMVDGFLSGRNRSSRHGFSVEFVEHREYVPGDDLRHLDWKVLGRMDRHYIKRYEEETNITALLLVDTSASMLYGSEKTTKFELAAYTASALSYLLHRQRDAVGIAFFDTEVRALTPPSAKRVAVAQIASLLEGVEPAGKTGFDEMVRHVVHAQPQRSLIILLSDCLVPSAPFAAGLKLLEAQGHDVLILQTLDAAEISFPFRSSVLFRGLEDARQLLVEPARIRRQYLDAFERFLATVRRAAEGCAFDHRVLSTHEPLAPVLASVLAHRARRKRVVARGRR